jgi:hypothetical protein
VIDLWSFTHGGTHRLASSRQRRRRSDVWRHKISEDAMRKNVYEEQVHTRDENQLTTATPPAVGTLPNRLLTAFDVAEFVGCHEETVRRA